MSRRRILIMDMEPEGGRFRVSVDGYMERWTLDRIKAKISQGYDLDLWENR
jgi:hypothetical protein